MLKPTPTKLTLFLSLVLGGCSLPESSTPRTRVINFGTNTPHAPQNSPLPNTPSPLTSPQENTIQNLPLIATIPGKTTTKPRGIFKTVANKHGDVYEIDTEHHLIRQLGLNQPDMIFVGHFQPGFKDGKGQEARFYLPLGMDIDEQGNLYVEDMGNRAVRLVTPDGTVTTLAQRAYGYSSREGASALATDNLASMGSWVTGTLAPPPSPSPAPPTTALYPGFTPRTLAARQSDQTWYCPQYFGKEWMAECHDKNGDGWFELHECSGKPPTAGFEYPKDCPVVPTPTPEPTPVGNCVEYMCAPQVASGKCCDTNLNGVYDAAECTGKTPENGFPLASQRCPL